MNFHRKLDNVRYLTHTAAKRYRYTDATVLVHTARRQLADTAPQSHLCHADAKESANEQSLGRYTHVMDQVIQKEKLALDKRAEALKAPKEAMVVLDGPALTSSPG